MALAAAAVPIACGRDRLERLLQVGGEHLPVLAPSLSGPELKLLDPVFSKPGAIRCVDPAIGSALALAIWLSLCSLPMLSLSLLALWPWLWLWL